MMDLRLHYRTGLTLALAAMLATPLLRADEPIAAPPAPLLDEIGASRETPAPVEPLGAGPGLLAPVATDLDDGVVVPAGRRSSNGRSLAPVTIGDSSPAYIPGQAGSATQIYPTTPETLSVPEGAITTYPEGSMTTFDGSSYMPVEEFNPNEATVRISDLPGDQVGANPPGVRPSSRICPECRYCKHGLPYHQCPECEPDEQMINRYRRRHGVVYPPSYGWSPPAKHPIDRVSIDYYRAFPGAWNGQPQQGPAVVRPTVYWPTDTTQLGYTYQHSPRWMPYPGMVPPVPHPAQWNIPFNTAYAGVGSHGPCPQCRGNASAPPPRPVTNTPSRPQSDWKPTDVTQLPVDGPALSSPGVAPALTPVPF